MSSMFLAVGALLAVLIGVVAVRCFLGPTVPDRVVGLDTVNTLVVAAMLVFGAARNEVVFIDVAVVYALLSFVGTLFIAKYLGKGL
ncbi:MAG: monovalent cation/H+ antiporter complex subunit F [Clostridia bacterium]|nr:monovalent cation/H+ antiporter complex subunit F [Clostridia bacterium]MDH7573027.1 monovalent cation/H+ antiporter complex subunit F [Clostridia bacterium]